MGVPHVFATVTKERAIPIYRTDEQGERGGNTVDPLAGVGVGAGHDGDGRAERQLNGAG